MSATYTTTDELEHPVPAPDSLRPWFTRTTSTAPLVDIAQPVAHLPRTSTTVVLRTEASGRRAAFVIGTRTRATYSRPEQPAGCVRLELAPGVTRQLLGVSAGELTDRTRPLAALPGPMGELAADLDEIPAADALEYLGAALPERVSETSGERARRELLDAALALLSGPDAPAVPAVAAGLAVSERQLRNVFGAGIGLSPKHFARIDRVRRVVASAGSMPWSHLAVTAGYYDQSHLTSDFRTMMGVPPQAYLRGSLPAPTACAAPR